MKNWVAHRRCSLWDGRHHLQGGDLCPLGPVPITDLDTNYCHFKPPSVAMARYQQQT